MRLIARSVSQVQKVVLCPASTLHDRSFDISGELGLQDYIVMEGVFEILGALTASMAIVDSEDLQLGPHLGRYSGLLKRGLDHVQNNRNSIFIGLPHCAHIRVRSKGFHRAKRLLTHFRVLKVRQTGDVLVLVEHL